MIEIPPGTPVSHVHVMRLIIQHELVRRDPAERPKFETALKEAFAYLSDLELKAAAWDQHQADQENYLRFALLRSELADRNVNSCQTPKPSVP